MHQLDGAVHRSGGQLLAIFEILSGTGEGLGINGAVDVEATKAVVFSVKRWSSRSIAEFSLTTCVPSA